MTPLVGEGNKRIYVQFYNRSCYETTAYNNLIQPMLSSQQSFDFIREPTITVANVPPTVYCGERTGFTPTASANQPGVTFSYSVPSGSGWSVNTVRALTVVPSGSNGTTLSVTPTYNCSGILYSGTPKAVQIGFSQSPTPAAFTSSILGLCPGQSQTVGITQVPGATSYTFSGIAPPLTVVQTNPGNWFVTVSAPAGLTTAVSQTLHVTANSGYGCAAKTADLTVKCRLWQRSYRH